MLSPLKPGRLSRLVVTVPATRMSFEDSGGAFSSGSPYVPVHPRAATSASASSLCPVWVATRKAATLFRLLSSTNFPLGTIESRRLLS